MPGAIEEMVDGLARRGISFIAPLTTEKGLGMSAVKYRHQRVDIQHSDISKHKLLQQLPASTQRVQNFIKERSILSQPQLPFKKVFGTLGFFFGIDSSIQKYEYRPGVFFNPEKVNLGKLIGWYPAI